jgi:hypothetical protein
MMIPGFVAPFLGFAVIVTLALAGYCVWIYFTTGEDGLQQCTKRLRVLYRAGMVITLVSVLCGVSLLLYAIGAAILRAV